MAVAARPCQPAGRRPIATAATPSARISGEHHIHIAGVADRHRLGRQLAAHPCRLPAAALRDRNHDRADGGELGFVFSAPLIG